MRYIIIRWFANLIPSELDGIMLEAPLQNGAMQTLEFDVTSCVSNVNF